MTNPIKKEKLQKAKIEINRRESGGKKKPDLFAKFRNTEHPLDSVIPDVIKVEGTLPYPTRDEPTLPDTTRPYPTKEETEKEKTLQSISPTRNFTKVSNSVIKQAIPDGLFRGQSKHTYDVLYQYTRGAINPVRAVQLTKSELVKLTGLEIKTIQRHLSFLRSVGLIVVDPKIGDHKGAIYTVHIPEEITLPNPTLVQSGVVETTIGETTTETVPHPSVNSTILGQGNSIANKQVTESPNTSLKTNTKTDDELVALNEVLRQIGKGKSSSWRELAELLKAEFETASSRTDSVSDAPAFLAEHLRRRLATKPLRTEKAKPFEPGKDEPIIEAEVFTPEPLSEQGREVVLNNLRRMPREEANGYQDHYTTEDWEWLVEKLG
jgi:hypothetical protein